MSDTPEIDEVEKHSGVTIKDSVTTCGDESSSVYIPVIFARQLERERNKALIDRANGEIATMTINHYERILKERNNAREAIIATLEENRHLADGDDCTLRKLKSVVPDWK